MPRKLQTHLGLEWKGPGGGTQVPRNLQTLLGPEWKGSGGGTQGPREGGGGKQGKGNKSQKWDTHQGKAEKEGGKAMGGVMGGGEWHRLPTKAQTWYQRALAASGVSELATQGGTRSTFPRNPGSFTPPRSFPSFFPSKAAMVESTSRDFLRQANELRRPLKWGKAMGSQQ